MDGFTSWLTTLLSAQTGELALFISSFVSSTILPGGSEALLVYLVTQSPTDALWLNTVATIGNTLGALTTYAIGRFIPSRQKEDKALSRMGRYGAPALLLSWLPVVGDGLVLAAGWLRVPFYSALAYIILGKAARYACVTWLTLEAFTRF